MIISVKTWIKWIQFLVLFGLFTILLFYALGWMSEWVQPTRRYQEPEGQSVKAFHQWSEGMETGSALDRLRFFYWFGE